jgi:hypothetical protein
MHRPAASHGARTPEFNCASAGERHLQRLMSRAGNANLRLGRLSLANC